MYHPYPGLTRGAPPLSDVMPYLTTCPYLSACPIIGFNYTYLRAYKVVSGEILSEI